MAFIETITVDVVLQKNTCWNCGGVYALTQKYLQKRREDGHGWYCPYCGKGTAYCKSEVDLLKEQLRKAENRASAELAAHDQTRASLRTWKGVSTRLKNRIAKGICPCCHRYFKDLHRHMQTKHPRFAGVRN